jgi:hypothetical protein
VPAACPDATVGLLLGVSAGPASIAWADLTPYGERVSSRLRRAEWLLTKFAGSVLVVGPTLANNRTAVSWGVRVPPSNETGRGLALLRDRIGGGRLIHSHAEPLTAQLAEARVTTTTNGSLALLAGPRTDGVRGPGVGSAGSG